MDITPMQRADAGAVARLHAATITEGFLARLGLRFLAQMYAGVAADQDSQVYVARDGARVVGFCAFSDHVAGLYRRVIRARWWRLGWASLPYTLNPWTVKEVLDTLRYPRKQAHGDLPPAEILTIGVDGATRGGGIGRALLEHALTAAAQRGVRRVKVLAGAKLGPANAFYVRCGFTPVTQIIQHGEPLNVYVRDLAPTTAGTSGQPPTFVG
jgi:GNAT superfamily N-acetyltransferase